MINKGDIPHRPPGYGFENGQAVPICWPAGSEPEADAPAALGIGDVLAFLITGKDSKTIGAKVVLLAFILRIPNAPQSFRQLGDCLGVSHTTARAMLSTLKAEIIEQFRV